MIHAVVLPYPDALEPTVATCACGWTLVYVSAGWNQATAFAENHVEDKTGHRSYTLEESGGQRTVRSGG